MSCCIGNLSSLPYDELILKSFLSRNPITMTRAFISYVRPLLEYCSPVWSPHFKQDIDLIENVQRSFTRKLFYCCNLVSKSYDDRLTYLGFQRLELRRIYADLIYMYKLIHNKISSSLINVFKFNNQVHCRETRGNIYKLFFNRSNKLVFSNFFTNRMSQFGIIFLIVVLMVTLYFILKTSYITQTSLVFCMVINSGIYV